MQQNNRVYVLINIADKYWMSRLFGDTGGVGGVWPVRQPPVDQTSMGMNL